MLKLTYTETGLYLERLVQSLEEWVRARVILSLRVGQKLLIEPSTASFLLPANLPGLALLQALAQLEKTAAVTISLGDAEYVEVSLRGTWLAADRESAEGDFVVVTSDSTESFIFKLWQDSLACASSLQQS